MAWNLQEILTYLLEMFDPKVEAILRYCVSCMVSYHLQKTIEKLYTPNLSKCTSQLMKELRFSGIIDIGQGLIKDKT